MIALVNAKYNHGMYHYTELCLTCCRCNTNYPLSHSTYMLICLHEYTS